MSTTSHDSAEFSSIQDPAVRVLWNSDILSHVFEYLGMDDGSPSEEEGTGRKHLYWAALTCKTFVDPALDVLWRSMRSLMPLIQILRPLELVGEFYVSILPI